MQEYNLLQEVNGSDKCVLWGNYLNLGMDVSCSLTDLTPKTYVTFYYYLFVTTVVWVCLTRIECFMSNSVNSNRLGIPEIVSTREESAELSVVVMSDAILCV